MRPGRRLGRPPYCAPHARRGRLPARRCLRAPEIAAGSGVAHGARMGPRQRPLERLADLAAAPAGRRAGADPDRAGRRPSAGRDVRRPGPGALGARAGGRAIVASKPAQAGPRLKAYATTAEGAATGGRGPAWGPLALPRPAARRAIAIVLLSGTLAVAVAAVARTTQWGTPSRGEGAVAGITAPSPGSTVAAATATARATAQPTAIPAAIAPVRRGGVPIRACHRTRPGRRREPRPGPRTEPGDRPPLHRRAHAGADRLAPSHRPPDGAAHGTSQPDGPRPGRWSRRRPGRRRGPRPVPRRGRRPLPRPGRPRGPRPWSSPRRPRPRPRRPPRRWSRRRPRIPPRRPEAADRATADASAPTVGACAVDGWTVRRLGGIRATSVSHALADATGLGSFATMLGEVAPRRPGPRPQQVTCRMAFVVARSASASERSAQASPVGTATSSIPRRAASA